MRYIKMSLFFLGALFGMALIGFFGSFGVYTVKEIFSYLFTHCSDLMWYIMFFIFAIIGVVSGWSIFCKFADKLKDS